MEILAPARLAGYDFRSRALLGGGQETVHSQLPGLGLGSDLSLAGPTVSRAISPDGGSVWTQILQLPNRFATVIGHCPKSSALLMWYDQRSCFDAGYSPCRALSGSTRHYYHLWTEPSYGLHAH